MTEDELFRRMEEAAALPDREFILTAREALLGFLRVQTEEYKEQRTLYHTPRWVEFIKKYGHRIVMARC